MYRNTSEIACFQFYTSFDTAVPVRWDEKPNLEVILCIEHSREIVKQKDIEIHSQTYSFYVPTSTHTSFFWVFSNINTSITKSSDRD